MCNILVLYLQQYKLLYRQHDGFTELDYTDVAVTKIGYFILRALDDGVDVVCVSYENVEGVRYY